MTGAELCQDREKNQMARQDGGRRFPIRNDNQILEIDSPQRRVGGRTYVVVDKSIDERWAVIALGWEHDNGAIVPSLGIRWFYETAGYPVSRGYSTWFLFPASSGEFNLRVVRDLLSIPREFAEQVELFLAGRITGEQLREWRLRLQ